MDSGQLSSHGGVLANGSDKKNCTLHWRREAVAARSAPIGHRSLVVRASSFLIPPTKNKQARVKEWWMMSHSDHVTSETHCSMRFFYHTCCSKTKKEVLERTWQDLHHDRSIIERSTVFQRGTHRGFCCNGRTTARHYNQTVLLYASLYYFDIYDLFVRPSSISKKRWPENISSFCWIFILYQVLMWLITTQSGKATLSLASKAITVFNCQSQIQLFILFS